MSRQYEKFLYGQSRTFLLTQPSGWEWNELRCPKKKETGSIG